MAAGFSKLLCNMSNLHSYNIISFLRQNYPDFFDIEFEDESINYSYINDTVIQDELLEKKYISFEYRISDISRIFIYIFYDGVTLVEDYEFFAMTSIDQNNFEQVFISRTVEFIHNKVLKGALFDINGNSRYECDWDTIINERRPIIWFSGLSFLAIPYSSNFSSISTTIKSSMKDGYYLYKFTA